MRIVMIVVRRCMCIVFIVMLARRCTTSGAEEGEVCSTRHVGSGHECANETDDHECVVTVVAYVVDYLILREETGERNTPHKASVEMIQVVNVIGITLRRPPMSFFMSNE